MKMKALLITFDTMGEETSFTIPRLQAFLDMPGWCALGRLLLGNKMRVGVDTGCHIGCCK
jgi:hypothetical protein